MPFLLGSSLLSDRQPHALVDYHLDRSGMPLHERKSATTNINAQVPSM